MKRETVVFAAGVAVTAGLLLAAYLILKTGWLW